MANQKQWNQDCCLCEAQAIIEIGADGEEYCSGCDTLGMPPTHDFCNGGGNAVNGSGASTSGTYGGFGNFIVDFFSPEMVDTLGGLIAGRTSPYTGGVPDYQDQEKKRNAGIWVILVVLLLVVGIIVWGRKKRKK